MAGTLYLVGTPIGNLEDLTMRALRVLREVDLIAAEDTRHTSRLLQHYSIATPTTSLHEHNEHGKAPRLVEKLIAGQSIALVSDAGMPLMSDPGAGLVSAARAAGINVEVIPGPSAITAALALAGISGPFAFCGFPPAKGTTRRAWMAEIGSLTKNCAVVFFEAPHRVTQTGADLFSVLGDRPIIVARELTKAHQELVIEPISALAAGAGARRGEFVLILPKAELTRSRAEPPSAERLRQEFGELTNNDGLKPRAAAKRLAEKYAMNASDIYRECAAETE